MPAALNVALDLEPVNTQNTSVLYNELIDRYHYPGI